MAPAPPSRPRRRKQLRSALRTARAGRPLPRDRDGDPDLLALVDEPYTGVAETHRRLRELLDAFEARGDRRAVFLAIYSQMTGAVAERVDAGEFVDPEWVGEYLVAFANLYREAVLDWETGALGSLADPWQIAFEAAEEGEAMIVQDAALGVNAHVNYDLALALDEVGVHPDPDDRYEDHTAVTDVIADLVDDAQASLADRGADGVAALDESLGEVDDWLVVFTIGECRDSAWRTAVAMNSRFRIRRRLARWINDVTSTGAAHLVLSTRAGESVHETLVDLEGSAGDPR